jgi:hypothetical protein
VRGKDAPPDSRRYSATYVRQDGRWLNPLLKGWGDEVLGKANVRELAWLIGTWESEGGDLKAKTTYEWDDSKKFIRGKYTLTPKKDGEKPSSGTQIIGVDPPQAS